MKTIREIINTHSIEKNEDILQDMVDELYTYVEYRENLKVIEELEKLDNAEYTLFDLKNRIRQLKQ